MINFEDRILINLPLKPEYVSVARLAISGIAARIGFDIETIEDIKVSVSEVCNKLVTMKNNSNESYTIECIIKEKTITIVIKAKNPELKCIFENNDEELSISIINALMDNVEYCPEEDIVISMSKSVEM